MADRHCANCLTDKITLVRTTESRWLCFRCKHELDAALDRYDQRVARITGDEHHAPDDSLFRLTPRVVTMPEFVPCPECQGDPDCGVCAGSGTVASRSLTRFRLDATTAELTRYEVDILAAYNGECARGLVHTPGWQARMADLQARFDHEHRG